MDTQKKIDEIGGNPEKQGEKLPEIRNSSQGQGMLNTRVDSPATSHHRNVS